MASVHIVTRTTANGDRRFRVRYRLGGRDAPILYGGSFRTKREAEERARWIGGELAARRVPDLRANTEPQRVETFAVVAERWRASRIDHAAETRKTTATHLTRILPTFGRRDPAGITTADVREWVVAQAGEIKPSSLRRYVATLRAVLDFAGVDPNPARDRSVRLPRIEREEPTPPTRAEVAAIIANVPPRWRLAIRVLEATGMRIGELAGLVWGDVDVASSRFRVSRTRTKTAAGQRWVQVPAPLMALVADTLPPDDRTATRPVFPGVTSDGAKNAMARACTAAGIAHYHPHDLRHRRLTLWHHQGVPARELAARAGHSRASMSLDVYSHVLVDGDDEWA